MPVPASDKNTEQQLRQSELFYRSLIADSLDGLLLTDENGIIGFASPSVEKILGYRTADILNTNAFSYLHPEDRDLGIRTFMDEFKMAPQIKFINVRLQKSNGEYIWCIVRGHNLMNNPNVGKMVVYFADDSLRKEAQQALEASEKRLQTQAIILNNVTDVIVTTDLNLERKVTSWNKVVEKLSGISEQEALGKSLRDVIKPDYSPYSFEQVTEIVLKEGIWKGEVSFMGHDGKKKFLLHTVSILHDNLGNRIGLLGVGKVITERKAIEERLQQSELFYRHLATNSLDGIFMTDEKSIITYCGPSVFKISGHEISHLLGHSMFEFVHPDDVPKAMSYFHTRQEDGLSLNYVVVRLLHATRGWVWSTVRGYSMLHDPVMGSVVVYFTDDSKRKEMEDQLRESEGKFRSLIYSLRQGVILHNSDSEIILYNPAALSILGFTNEDLKGAITADPKWAAIYEDGRECPLAERPLFTSISTQKPVRDMVLGVRKPSTGERVWLLINAEPMLDTEGNLAYVISSFTDITEQKHLSQKLFEQEIHRQRQLTQATIDGQEKERQEIGKELHDNINQHLTTTRLYLEVAKEKASGEVLEMIKLAHKNMADIVNEIRHLSQSLVPPTLGDLGLVESVLELCNSLKRAHSFNVKFLHRYFREKDIPDKLKLMIFRIIQEQVSNIINHANASAMHIKLQSDAEYINLSIGDNGKGVDLQNYKRGMGLNNISNRAAMFNGRMEIDAAPGKGCTITVVIPKPALNA